MPQCTEIEYWQGDIPNTGDPEKDIPTCNQMLTSLFTQTMPQLNAKLPMMCEAAANALLAQNKADEAAASAAEAAGYASTFQQAVDGVIPPDASTSEKGIAEFATDTEASAGTATDKMVTPKQLGLKVNASDVETGAYDNDGVGKIPKRDSSGDIHARLFRMSYSPTNANCNLFATLVNTGSNNYIRPSTPAQVMDKLVPEVSKAQTGWLNLSKVNGWTGSLYYYRTKAGTVFVYGAIKNGSGSSGWSQRLVGTLPYGFRPIAHVVTLSDTNRTYSNASTQNFTTRVELRNNGQLYVDTVGNYYHYFYFSYPYYS